jgi:hypothetical protein
MQARAVGLGRDLPPGGMPCRGDAAEWSLTPRDGQDSHGEPPNPLSGVRAAVAEGSKASWAAFECLFTGQSGWMRPPDRVPW